MVNNNNISSNSFRYKNLFLLFSIIIFLTGISCSIDSKASNQADIPKEQYFTVGNNGSILAVASLKEITRISFNSDVMDINAIAGELEYSVNGKDIFLRTNSEKPVNFFIKLESGWTYKFILTIEDIPATQIFVGAVNGNDQLSKKSLNIFDSKLRHKETISPLLKKRISKILEVTFKPKRYIGYEIQAEHKQLRTIVNNLEMKLVGTVSGDRLKAEKIFLINKSNRIIKVNLNHFMKQENLAVYLTDNDVLPGKKSVLIIISEI